MRRLLCASAAIAVLSAQQAQAQSRCPSTTDETVFELQALKSELVVLAIGCKLDERYNAFVHRYSSVLSKNEGDFTAYFKRADGRNAQKAQDDYITQLANAHSQEGIKQGQIYCERNTPIFDEVMALPGPTDLPAYAAGKDVVPDTVGACAEPAAAPARTATTRSTARRRS